MRFSTLTIIVFVAHTSSLAIAAPVPFPDEVQDLVARGDNNPPASSSGSSGPSVNLKQVASRFAKIPLHSPFASVVQKAVGAVANADSLIRPFAGPIPRPPSPPPALQTVLSKWKQTSSSAFQRPGDSESSFAKPALHWAVAAMHERKAHPTTSALQQLNREKSRHVSPTREAPSPSHKGSSAGKATAAHKPHKASLASHRQKEAKASEAHKVSQMRKSAAERRALASPKKGKASKLRKRELEIEEPD